MHEIDVRFFSYQPGCFKLLKSHDKRSLPIEVEFYESLIHTSNLGNLVRKLKSQVRYTVKTRIQEHVD